MLEKLKWPFEASFGKETKQNGTKTQALNHQDLAEG
jgi:hypothetical protein